MRRRNWSPLLVGTAVGLALLSSFSWLIAQSNDKFAVSETWAQLPPSAKEWGPISSVTSDDNGSILVLRRTFPSLFVFSSDGKFLKSWGAEGLFQGPGAHGVRVSRDGSIWATDTEYHLVYKLSQDGKVLMQIGKKGIAGDNSSQDAFNKPADVVVAPNGDFFVADGYGNSRVVKFSKNGKFLKIIGGNKGSEPGQFNLVHSVVIDSQGRLLVGDRSNARVQIFDQDGKLIDIWTGLGKPYGLYISNDNTLYVGDADGGTITIAKNGKPVDVIRNLGRPHWITLDSSGAIYMADVRGFVKKIVPQRPAKGD
jgi:sugar lactone lactonase YvrE